MGRVRTLLSLFFFGNEEAYSSSPCLYYFINYYSYINTNINISFTQHPDPTPVHLSDKPDPSYSGPGYQLGSGWVVKFPPNPDQTGHWSTDVWFNFQSQYANYILIGKHTTIVIIHKPTHFFWPEMMHFLCYFSALVLNLAVE